MAGRWAFLSFALLASACHRDEPATSLIVICVDTLRADHVHAYGYERDTTPTIDALASKGARFDRALSTSNWTVPAVASVLTSTLPSRHGAGVPGEVKNLDQDPPTPIDPHLETLADILKGRGFETGLFSSNPFLYGSFKRSFDSAQVERIAGADLADAAIDWISKHPQERHFLYVQFMDVHHPNLPPEPYFSSFPTPGAGPREKRHSEWAFGRLVDSKDPAFLAFRENRLAVYDGSIRYVDAQIGRLLGRIEELGILKRAVVVIYADHGEEFWDHAEAESVLNDDPRGIWGIGHGHSMYQDLIRVPLIIVRGDHATAVASDCPVSLLDIAPTALELLGIQRAEAMEGRSLVDLLEGRGQCPRRALVAESPSYGPDSTALVVWPMKLVTRGESTQLYSLLADPAERIDLSERDVPTTERMRALLERVVSSRSVSGPAPEVDPETLEQLRALGYLDH